MTTLFNNANQSIVVAVGGSSATQGQAMPSLFNNTNQNIKVALGGSGAIQGQSPNSSNVITLSTRGVSKRNIRDMDDVIDTTLVDGALLQYQANTNQYILSLLSSITNVTLFNATIDSLAAPLSTSDGGTGLSSFQENAVFFASDASTMAQVSGTTGQVMFIDGNVPTFGDLDGGTF